MSTAAPFTWLDSNGWLVLSGKPDALGEIRAQALSRCAGASDIAYISLAADLGDALIEDMAELGAPSGYLVELDDSDNNEVYDRLSAAGMIVIEADRNAEALEGLISQTAISALKAALERGALILFEGAAVSIAAERRLNAKGEWTAGLNFIQHALISSSADSDAQDASPQAKHVAPLDVPVIVLAPGAALALGPARQIETWGDGEVTISLRDPARRPIDHP
ncbi:MAG: hypothetical protein OXG53_00325 [Chloroflexi bacterium]|nr:hypothetical protein [Chloroflexota bacterium]